MRTDVKVGIAGGALILIVAVAYYGAKRNEGFPLAEGEQSESSPLDELLGHAQGDAKAQPGPARKAGEREASSTPRRAAGAGKPESKRKQGAGRSDDRVAANSKQPANRRQKPAPSKSPRAQATAPIRS